MLSWCYFLVTNDRWSFALCMYVIANFSSVPVQSWILACKNYGKGPSEIKSKGFCDVSHRSVFCVNEALFPLFLKLVIGLCIYVKLGHTTLNETIYLSPKIYVKLGHATLNETIYLSPKTSADYSFNEQKPMVTVTRISPRGTKVGKSGLFIWGQKSKNLDFLLQIKGK